MKKFLIMLLTVLMLSGAVAAKESANPYPQKPIWNSETDYITLIEGVLKECGENGLDIVKDLETKRNQKIIDTNAAVDCTSLCEDFDNAEDMLRELKAYKLRKCRNYTDADVDLLAHVIYMEAGAEWLPDALRFCVGEVVMNRVLSDIYPDTVYEVVHQPGQYDRTWVYQYQEPDKKCYDIAKRLLDGERMMEPKVLYQSGVPQGRGTYKVFYDSILCDTYFCF